ncbi:hypothetical protein HZS_5885, partial [Henneguya salminicola]
SEITVCVNIQEIPAKYYTYNLKILVELSTNVSSFVLLNSNDIYSQTYTNLIDLPLNEKKICTNIKMYFKFKLEYFDLTFKMNVKASLKMDNSQDCDGYCLRPIPISGEQNFKIELDDSIKGTGDDSKYNFKLLNEVNTELFSETLSLKSLNIQLENKGASPIYFTKIIIIVDQFTSLSNVFWSGVSNNSITKLDRVSSTGDTNIRTSFFVSSIINVEGAVNIINETKIDLTIELSIFPNVMIGKEVNISIIASEYFNIYKESELKPQNPKFEYSFTFTVIEKYSLDYFYEATPAEILLNKGNELLNFNSPFLYLSLEIINKGPSPVRNVIVKIKAPIYYESK